MSRRDTILIAVLINAGLLVILFATAVKGDKRDQQYVVQVSQTEPQVTETVYTPPVQTVLGDEVDQVIQEFQQALDPQKIVEVTVKRGDSLDKIARGNGTTIDAIMRASELEDTRLQIGQVLRVPVGDEPVVVQQYVASSEEFYTVRSGDNPSVIAMKFHIPLEELLELNDLNEESARKLRPGDKLRIQ